MIFVWRPRFRREFAALPGHIRERARKQLLIFSENPAYPSLRTKKMAGCNIWEGRITQGYRFTYSVSGDTYTLRRIGTHDILKHP